jgi:hypothetical protein
MKAMALLLKLFGYVWVAGGVALILIGLYGIWLEGGLSAVREVLNPTNIWNFIVTVITLAPGLIAVALSDKLKSKSGRSKL